MSVTPVTDQLHGTCIAIAGDGVLLLGASGAGKSDIALRLIDAGAHLVADDQVCLSLVETGEILARPPAPLTGVIEARGLGVIRVSHVAQAPVRLIVRLIAPGDDSIPPRHPAEGAQSLPTESLCGKDIPVMTARGLESSLPAKIRLALKALAGNLFTEHLNQNH